MREKKVKNFYPPMIILFICGFLLFLIWSAFQAAGLGSKVTDADYYSKGLKYNTTQIEKQAAEVMGWHLKARLEGRRLIVTLTDKMGNPVNRATGSLYLAIPGTAENIHLPVTEDKPGTYAVMLGKDMNGSLQARLEMEREDARINRSLLLNLQ